jgi:predicted alpha/beta-hydrolase family hydrolase
MNKAIVEYSFSETNNETLVFVPGYSGGLEVSTITELVDFFVKKGGYNVFGLNLDYQHDVPDVFAESQSSLVEMTNGISNKTPGTAITLLAKSLGGSLAIFNAEKLNISRIVVLGCSVILGWPQRVSLLDTKNPIIPDYKREWGAALENISVPTLILAGISDDLCDREYLSEVSKKNQNLHIAVIESNHNLEDVKTLKFKFADVAEIISKFILN